MNTEIHGHAKLPTQVTTPAIHLVCVQTFATLKLTLLLLHTASSFVFSTKYSFMTQLPVVSGINCAITLSHTPYANYKKHSEEKSKSLHTAHV